MPEKANLNGIQKFVQKHTNKYSQYLYYHWVHQLVVLQFSSYFKSSIVHIFPSLPTRCTLKYILTSCTSTTNVTLNWKNFVEWYELFFYCEEMETCALSHYPNLTHFLIYWSSYKKFIFVTLVRLDKTPPSAWRLGPRGIRLRWKNQWERRPCSPYHNICEVDCLQIAHKHTLMC